MQIIERFIQGKHPDPDRCEDAFVATPDFAAVIDGATDKTGVSYGGKTGGRVAAECVADTLRYLDPDADLRTLVNRASSLLRKRVVACGADIDPHTQDGPTAVFVAYSRRRREVWRVGDTLWMGAGEYRGETKRIDEITTAARVLLLRALVRDGASVEELAATDPGWEMILPMLKTQHLLRNIDQGADDDLAYGAIDGRYVPDRFLEVWAVPEGSELVLQTDGYLELEASLDAAESALKQDLIDDPLRIGAFPCTKGVAPGNCSFDDRAYIRLLT